MLKGVVRAERLPTPTDFISPILDRVKKEYLQRHFGVGDWDDANDFLTKLALKYGKLLRGGEPDLNNVAVQVINDWQRGKLPFFVAPPSDSDGANEGGGCGRRQRRHASCGQLD